MKMPIFNIAHSFKNLDVRIYFHLKSFRGILWKNVSDLENFKFLDCLVNCLRKKFSWLHFNCTNTEFRTEDF